MPAIDFPGSAPAYRRPNGVATHCALAIAFMVGTGGVGDVRYLKKRSEFGYSIVGVHGAAARAQVAPRSPAQDLQRIREVFEPPISDLASLFGVSRQAMYNWINGEQPKPEFAARLDDLAQAADLIAAENLPDLGRALKRKISNGKTLFDLVAAGESARAAAQKLSAILRREAEEREILDAKLSARRSATPQAADLGSPMLDERA